MANEYQILLPKLGESIVSATVVQWFKKEGDTVLLDEPLLEVSTDKVNSEIPSPVAGVLQKICAQVDEELQVGELLAIVEPGQSVGAPAPSMVKAAEKKEETTEEDSSQKEYFSPAVLRMATEKGISFETLKTIQGTGAGGRITKHDVEGFAERKTPECKPVCPLSKEERVKMTGMRKAIADNMVKSFYEAPHATLIHEVDVTPIIKYIQTHKEDFLTTHGAKLTVTSFVFQALTKALQEFPMLNSSLEKDTIVVKKYVNLGLAVNVEQGLLVPVVKNCQSLTLPGIAKAIQELSHKARESKLQPNDVLEGTMTVTNFGMSGISIGVPIIRYPEVAILGIGSIKKRVQVLEDDVLAIRSMLYLSLTFDHRVIDGMYGCAFLNALQKHLEKIG